MYARLSDSDAEQARDDLIKTKGFFILPRQLFCSVRSRAPLDENLNETLEAVFQAIEDSAKGSDSEANFSGLFDDNFNFEPQAFLFFLIACGHLTPYTFPIITE